MPLQNPLLWLFVFKILSLHALKMEINIFSHKNFVDLLNLP